MACCAAVAALALAGCKKKERTRPPGPLVRKVEIDGNTTVPDEDIVPHLNLQPTSPVTFGDRSYYLPGLEEVDRRRVGQVYEAEGFLQAEVAPPQVEVRRADKRVERQRAYVRFRVDEGQPTRVRRIEFDWIGDSIPPARRGTYELACGLHPPARFGVAPLGRGKDKIVAALEDDGFAYARVDEQAWIDPEQRLADVAFEIAPGPFKKITKIEVRGLARVPERLVVQEVDFVVGKPFSRKRVEQVQAGIYAMGVFSTVSVARGRQTAGEGMTLIVTVIEADMQRVKIGPGVLVDPVRWQQHGTVQYEHRNLFGRLYGFTARLRAGYAELPAPWEPRQHGPIVDLDLQLRKKGLLEKRLVWTESPGFELGIWQGYQFYAVTNRIGVSRFFTRWVEVGLSYNNRFVDLFNIEPELDANRTVLGLDFRDPYFLAFFQLSPTLHLTDDIIEPHNGVRLSVNYDIANRYFGGQFNYNKVEPDLRAYYRPHERVQFAARGRIGMAFPYGERAGIPIDQKFYLGGANDVRGWPLRRLSPRVSLCPETPTRCEGTPVGGLTMVHSSLELRVRLVAELWIAGFSDMGDVQEGLAAFDGRGLLFTTGGGFRYHSPVGTLRLDVGGQLNEDPRFPEPRRWALHFGIGEAF